MSATKRVKVSDNSSTLAAAEPALSIDVIGVRDGEVFTGLLSSNIGAVIRISFTSDAPEKILRPLKAEVEALRSNPNLQARLMRVPFFKALGGFDQALEWLSKNCAASPVREDERLFEAAQGIQVHFLSLGHFDESTLRKTGKLKKDSVFANPSKLAEEDQQWLLAQPRLYADIAARLPQLTRRAGATLISCFKQWAYFGGIVTEPISPKTHLDVSLVIDISTGELKSVESMNGATCTLIPVSERTRLGVCNSDVIPVPADARKSPALLIATLLDAIHIESSTSVGLDGLTAFVSNCTPGELKSLLQKLIRFAPQNVLFPTYPLDPKVKSEGQQRLGADLVLLATIAGLACKTGYFLPDLGLYVSGVHSLAKRLLVILTEDAAPAASVAEEQACRWRSQLVSLAAAALISKHDLNWFPTKTVLVDWVKLAVGAMRSPKCFNYDVSRGAKQAPYSLEAIALSTDFRDKELPLVNALLDAVGSFTGDKDVIRDIAAQKLQPVATAPGKTLLEHPNHTMPLHHYIDQHISGNLIYLMPREKIATHFVGAVAAASTETKSAPSVADQYKTVFNSVFSTVTGWNPRRNSRQAPFDDETASSEVVKIIRKAQLEYFIAKHLIRSTSDNNDSQSTRLSEHDVARMQIKLDDKWLAALVGDLEVTTPSGTKFYVVLNVNDIRGPLRATKKPSRDGNTTVDEGERALAISIAESKLAQGDLALRACDSPHPKFHGAKFRRTDEGKLEIALSSSSSSSDRFEEWAQVSTIHSDIAVCKAASLTTKTDLTDFYGLLRILRERPEFDMCHQAFERLDELLLHQDITHGAAVRALQWLSARGHIVQLPDIARDPSTSKDRPMKDDVLAYQRIMLPIAALFPGALAPVDGSIVQFSVRDFVLLCEVRKRVASRVDSFSSGPAGVAPSHSWPDKAGVDTYKGRTPLEFQQKAIEILYSRFLRAAEGDPEVGRGQLLWMAPGSGKTSIVLKVLGELKFANKLPSYVLYIAPFSAFATVKSEMSLFGFEVISGSKATEVTTNLRKTPHKHKIILLEHDWLRDAQLSVLLQKLLPDSICCFDEMHKMLNDTLRTSFTLVMAQAARMFVAFTGTPIVNADPLKLCQWLAMALGYHVTARNIWTSMNAFITIDGYKEIPHTNSVIAIDTRLNNDKTYLKYNAMMSDSSKLTTGLLLDALRAVWKLAYDEMAQLAIEHLQQASAVASRGNKRVVLVVYTQADSVFMQERLLAHAKGQKKVALYAADICQLGSARRSGRAKSEADASSREILQARGIINFTDASVAGAADSDNETVEKVPDYKVIIIPIAHATGYSLSRAEVLITSVYPSSEATRAQIRGRIMRVDQAAPELYYITVTGGILTKIYEHYKSAQSLAAAVKCVTLI